jgi:hypothetical protein
VSTRLALKNASSGSPSDNVDGIDGIDNLLCLRSFVRIRIEAPGEQIDQIVA